MVFHQDDCSRVPLKDNVTAIGCPAVAKLNHSERGLYQEWLQYAKAMAHGGFDYLQDTVFGRMKSEVQVYEAARLCHPWRTWQLKWGVTEVRRVLQNPDLFHHAPILRTFNITALISELPQYILAVETLQQRREPFGSRDIMPFWKSRSADLPTWSAMARAFATMTTSSAAAERAFSILNNSFSQRQTAALEDYVSLSVMLQYNRSKLRGDESLKESDAIAETDSAEIIEVSDNASVVGVTDCTGFQ